MAHAFLFVDDSALHHQMYRLIFSRGALAAPFFATVRAPTSLVPHCGQKLASRST